jgi:DNA-binding MarR family transcriptional regulator
MRDAAARIAGPGIPGLTWFCLALVPAWHGHYQASSSRIPVIQGGILLPIAVGVALYWLSSSFRRVIDALPQSWIVALQLYRAEGVIFLILYAGGHLPGVFAWPAALGDMIVGLSAPLVAAAYARNPAQAASRLRSWNLFGILDLIVAPTTAFLTSPSPFQRFSLHAPNVLITAFPSRRALSYAPGVLQKKLAELLGIDSTTLTRTLAFLRGKGWTRSEAGADRRALRHFLTEAGKREFERVRPYWQAAQKGFRKAVGEESWKQMMNTAAYIAEIKAGT